jgi:hypothetical protein
MTLTWLLGVAVAVAVAVALIFTVCCCAESQYQPVLETMDRAFTLQHPTRMGASPVKRRTQLGGVFTLLLVFFSTLITAYLIERFLSTTHSARTHS